MATIQHGIWYYITDDAANNVNDGLAATRQLITGALQLSLPPNQWQIEVEYNHARIMALLQVATRAHVMWPSTAEVQRYITPPVNDAGARVCRSIARAYGARVQ